MSRIWNDGEGLLKETSLTLEGNTTSSYNDVPNPIKSSRDSYGALAHLVERNNGIVEVNGSSPLRSIR